MGAGMTVIVHYTHPTKRTAESLEYFTHMDDQYTARKEASSALIGHLEEELKDSGYSDAYIAIGFSLMHMVSRTF